MTDQHILWRLWNRLPVLVRAVLSGGLVFLILQSGWSLLIVTNMKVAPSIPWSVPLALLYLWVAFQYFNGRWKPASTSKARQESMRARRLSRHEWPTALAATAAVIVFIISTTIISYRMIRIPAEDMGLPETSGAMLYAVLLMVSIVAGVSEEAGFRGYMQTALEKRYGAVFAVGVSAVMFWLAHLNHANGVPRVVSLCIMGASLGIITVCARSILPAMLAHATADSIIFVGSAAGIGPDYLWNPVPLQETGLDGFFWVTIGAVVVSGAGGYALLRRLARLTRPATVQLTRLTAF
ncbi:MAG TPA: type II CAAX endopeptidase family protein [Candidatus Krumholzibacteria bacterium]|nr:type II CAAX endopeptidase family protein [Candidatus Krumholzibacteria bacterium]